MTFPDPAAAFTGPLVKTDHRAAEPIDHRTRAAGLLPDPRNPNGPTHYRPVARRPFVEMLGLAVLDLVARSPRLSRFLIRILDR